MKKLFLPHVVILSLWALTLVFTIGAYLAYPFKYGLDFKDEHVLSNLSLVIALPVPQLTVITTFFFKTTGQEQRKLATDHREAASIAVGLSLLYHVFLWILLSLLVFSRTAFGPDIDEKTKVLIQFIGYLSVLGLTPVTYLFSAGSKGAANTDPKTEENRPAQGLA